jgi:hypothetical protein
MCGWIKIHRSITNHWLYSEKRVYSKLEAWYDILLNVNYTDNKVMIKGKLYEVKRGESILSYESWGKRWNWDKSKVRRFFNLLQNDSMIELKCDNTTTHLTVCKYESYQGERNADETQTKRKRNTDETNIRKKEEKKEINIPELSEFLAFAIQECSNINQEDVKHKYKSWILNDWKDGNDKPIKNWKTKLLNTIPHLKKIEIQQPRIIHD